jgi:hypothetical protein
MVGVSAGREPARVECARRDRGPRVRVNGEDEPSGNATWLAVKMIAAAVALTLILVFVIDMGGGH